MSSKEIRPKWWQVYLIFPLLIALFAIDNRLKISTRGHETVQIGIVLLVYGLVHLWIKANSRALSRMDQAGHPGMVRVIRILPADPPALGREGSSGLKLPDTEIKGLLSNTFEIGYIDTESFPMHEVQQELNEE